MELVFDISFILHLHHLPHVMKVAWLSCSYDVLHVFRFVLPFAAVGGEEQADGIGLGCLYFIVPVLVIVEFRGMYGLDVWISFTAGVFFNLFPILYCRHDWYSCLAFFVWQLHVVRACSRALCAAGGFWYVPSAYVRKLGILNTIS